MSYSFIASGTTKVEALDAVAAEIVKVVAAQPTHEADRKGAMAAAEAFVGALRDPVEGEQVVVGVSGSLGWTGDEVDAPQFTSASVNVSASIRTI